MESIHLSDYLDLNAISLELQAGTKDKVLEELVALLNIDPESKNIALELVRSREALGSTGIGKEVAIPHLRSTIFSQITLVYGRSLKGIDFGAVDGKPVRHFFLVASPPIDPSNLYHPILAKIVQLIRLPKNRKRLGEIDSKAELLNLIDELAS
ncbi:MAG: PTS sugar transporter subunit IIA [Candidatus Eisenbacteria bacterium]|nr:PTS sugar transporter subunit IIA [Candidatus Eisenbacteria bacterium]